MSALSTPPPITGHGLCRRICYRAAAAPLCASYCRCPSCRRATGSLLAAFAGFWPADMIFEGEAPVRYASSPGVARQFCGTRGSQLTYRSERWSGQIFVLLGSADDLEGTKPESHTFCEYQVLWFEVADTLPRHSTAAFPVKDLAPESRSRNGV